MAYTYPIDPKAMFEDRSAQFIAFGIPAADLMQVRDVVNDMWANEPGGWVYEWSELARRYQGESKHYLASLAYGCGKFPCLADRAKADALRLQAQEYLAASSGFPVRFERRLVSVPYSGGEIEVPVHILSAVEDYGRAPVLLVSGGVDTWKMDCHQLFIALARGAGLTVYAFDHPGTGETPVPLNAAADEVVLALAREARRLGNGRVGHFGLSFGANFSAMTGLLGAVDAAIVLGAPVDASFHSENLQHLPFGMADILGNAFGLDHKPELDELLTAASQLSRRELLRRPSNSPMLVINGADDYFVPKEDTPVFKDRTSTEVMLLPGTGHCAVSKMAEVMPVMIGWLRTQLRLAEKRPS